MPNLITETVDGEVLTMVEPHFIVTIKNKGETWFLRRKAWTSFEERATEYETIEAARADAIAIARFTRGGDIVIVPRGGDFVR
jgi:hypothetical protein